MGSQALAWEAPDVSQMFGSESNVTVYSGESLYDIARRNGYALEHLAEANELPVSLGSVGRTTVMIPGRRIVPADPPKSGLIVNLPERGFYAFRAGKTPSFFPIAVGEPGRFATPTGSFTIVEKVENPDWIAPEWAGLGEDNVIEAGPDNPLGDRWIGLSSNGLGMHSTNNPSSIGSATSHGCMRMYPELARIVFDLVSTGWPVRIEYETSRLAFEKDGLYVAVFPDIYHLVDRGKKLRTLFAQSDLLGFYRAPAAQEALTKSRGVPMKVAAFGSEISVAGSDFPSARIQDRLYLEQSALEAAGVAAVFSLPESSVTLQYGAKTVPGPLYLTSEKNIGPDQVFLSRGTAWYPARKTLKALGLVADWDPAIKRLKVVL